ncbi:MAG: hypothetical protein R2824_19775 [Saprospiraceae bacterium]|nr:hypothetical protein [Lewinella sp.]
MIFPHNLYAIEKNIILVDPANLPNQDLKTIPSWLQALQVDGQPYFYFDWIDDKGNKIDGLLDPKKPYTFTKILLTIPSFFQPIVVDESGTVVEEVDTPKERLEKHFTAFFAVRFETLPVDKEDGQARKKVMNDKSLHEGAIFKSYRDDIFLGQGPDLCATACSNLLGYSSGNKDKLNTRNLFFKFNHHYFFPIIFSNGMTCYYAFENKREINCILEKFTKSDHDVLIGGYSPPYYDNILGVMVVKHIRLIIDDEMSSNRQGPCS